MADMLVFSRIDHKFNWMSTKRVFVHWYVGHEGMENNQRGSEPNILALVAELRSLPGCYTDFVDANGGDCDWLEEHSRNQGKEEEKEGEEPKDEETDEENDIHLNISQETLQQN